MAMREITEFRIDEEFAPMLFHNSEGKKDMVRVVQLETSDPRYKEVGRLERELLESKDRPFFFSWNTKRKYTREELKQAGLFSLRITSVFEPPGEECGTVYDESTACPRCFSGATRTGPLRLDVKRIPSSRDFAKTIADEAVVSRRVVELIEKHQITGAEFTPVRKKGLVSEKSTDWFSIDFKSARAEIVAPTQAGNDPFDYDPKGEYRCPLGDLIGLNLLSEVSVRSGTCVDADIVCTRQFVGCRRGLLRPERVILISPRAWRLFDAERLRGVRFEVAHLV